MQKILRIIVPALLSCALAIAIYAFTHGFPITAGIQNREDIVSVGIVQDGEAILITDPERMKTAAEFASTLTARMPKSDGGAPETEYTFTFSDGTALRVGGNSDTVFKNGKQYSGVRQNCGLFYQVTKGIFFSAEETESGA